MTYLSYKKRKNSSLAKKKHNLLELTSDPRTLLIMICLFSEIIISIHSQLRTSKSMGVSWKGINVS